MNYDKFTADVHQNAVEHGWWDNSPSIDDMLVLKHEYNKTRPYRHGGELL
ncbi:hypothetical protein RFF05_06670 [Bengtsoniella intestinalis]